MFGAHRHGTRARTWVALAIALAAGRASADAIEPPRARSTPIADWPAGRAETHDVVVPVTLTVAPDGSVADVVVDATLGPALDAAAVATARGWTFEPAKQDGRPVAARVRAVVRFVGVSAPIVAPPAATATPEAEPPAPPAAPSAEPVAVPTPAAPPTTVRVVGERPTPPRSASDVIVDRPTLGAAPHRTANDLLLTVPGVYITQHSGEGKAYQIFFRGFDAVHGQDLEIWAGGAPVNDVSNLHGQGYADLHFLMPEVVRQIRSSPGSYDPRQGDFAVAGSMYLDLGYDEPGITAKATAGQFNTRRYFLAYRPKDAPETTFAAFEVYATDGFGPSRAARRSSAVAQATYDLGESTRARVMASTYAARFDSAGVLRLADIQSGAVDRFATYDPKQGGSSSRTQIVLEVGETSEGGRWSIAPYFVLRSMRLRSDFTGFLQDAANGDSEQQINDATTVGATGWYRLPFRVLSKKDVLEAGFFARTDWIEQSQRRLSIVDDSVTANEVDAKVRATDTAGYLDAAIHPIARVTARAGVRIDGLSYSTEDNGGKARGEARAAQGAHLGKKGTLEVVLVPGLSAVASYGEGFRSPQARSLAEGQTTPFTQVVSYEAGLRYRNEVVRASVAGFRTVLSDDLVFDQTTARNETVPGTVRAGFSAEGVARPLPWINASASATYTRAAFQETARGFAKGDLLPYVPQWVVRGDFAITPTIAHAFERPLDARLGAGITALHDRPLPYGEMGHDVFLLDATASVRFREVQLGVDVFNLLDARWYDGEFTYASNFSQGSSPALVPLRHVTVGAPRTVLASLTVFL